jgi:hypothetical protein
MDRCCNEILADPSDDMERAIIGDLVEYNLLEGNIDGIYSAMEGSFLCEAGEDGENPLDVLVSRCRAGYAYGKKTSAEYEDALRAFGRAVSTAESGDPQAIRRFAEYAGKCYTDTEVMDPSDPGDVIRAGANEDYQKKIEGATDFEKVFFYLERVFRDVEELSFSEAFNGDEEEIWQRMDGAKRSLDAVLRKINEMKECRTKLMNTTAEICRIYGRRRKNKGRFNIAAAAGAFIAALGMGALHLHCENKEHERMANLPAVEYIVQPGDTFYGLSERFISDKDRYEKQAITGHVMEMNGYNDISRLRPGDRITLPTEGMDSAEIRELGGRQKP